MDLSDYTRCRHCSGMKHIDRECGCQKSSRSPGCYVVEHADYDGYSQRFSKIGDWETVKRWAKDGSIRKGDRVYLLAECEQPEITEAT